MTNYNLMWKARFIITMDGHVDLPPDRQGLIGGDPDDAKKMAEERMAFLAQLEDVMPSRTLFDIIRSKILAREIDTRKAADVVLFDGTHESEHWLIKGNSNASAGYFYVEARRVGERTITLPCYGIKVTIRDKNGEITSEMHDGADGRHEEVDTAYDAIESLILAHAIAGVDVASPAYTEGIVTAVEAATNALA